MSQPHMRSAALAYAGMGVPVFPVNGKVPITEHGFHDATTDRAQIEEWWARHPSAGIGTAAFDAIDVDLYKPACTPTWERIRPLIPKDTPQNKTGGGGLQFLFEAGTLRDGKIGPGVDSRYAGRNYIVLPPSLHPSGNRYEAVLSLTKGRLRAAPDFPRESGDSSEFRHLLAQMDAGKKVAEDRNKAAWWRAVEILRTLPVDTDLGPVEALVQSWVDTNCAGDLREVAVRKQVHGAAKFVADERRKSASAKSPNTYLRSDLGNAELFADRYAHRLRHIKERRLWLVWESGRWRSDVTGAAERAAKALARERLRVAADVENDDTRKKAVMWAMTSQSDSRIRAALSQATTETALVLRAEDLDADPFLIACANGTLDLRTGELRGPNPDDLISLGNDVPYFPDATCPRWDRFLGEVFGEDEELIGFVQRLAGYSLTGDIREQIVAVLHGGGNNGKDTLIKPLLRVVGEQAETSPMDTFTRVRDRSVRNDLARLHRARLVIASESAEGRRLDEPTIKLVSGGGRVAARFLYGEFFEFTPQFKVWLIKPPSPCRRRRRRNLAPTAADPVQRLVSRT
jgi:putative DNA primase/helicase